ncbi:MAG: c-type cytochrome biogenesis protein CcmI [Hyphomicrobium sp.]
MLLWIAFAILTAAAVAALLGPLRRETADVPSASDADMAVYRDQLAEIAADRERGLLGDNEAESARAEVARRVLGRHRQMPEAADTAERSQVPHSSRDDRRATKLAATMLAAGVPLLALALYLTLGSPALPGRPYVDPGSKPIEQASEADLVALVEARLRQYPDEGKGWDVIAPVYLGQQRFAEAADAFAKSLKLLGETPARLKGLAEATILANNGLVTEPARRAFQRILELQPGNGEARFGLALAMEQDGKIAEAAEEYRQILEAAPPDARWRPALEVKLARLLRGGDGGEGSAGLDKAQRDKLVLSMVERLAARLKTDGGDLAGWQQLVRSYKVLGRVSDAADALAAARRNFAGNAEALSDLDAFAKSIGMGS